MPSAGDCSQPKRLLAGLIQGILRQHGGGSHGSQDGHDRMSDHERLGSGKPFVCESQTADCPCGRVRHAGHSHESAAHGTDNDRRATDHPNQHLVFIEPFGHVLADRLDRIGTPLQVADEGLADLFRGLLDCLSHLAELGCHRAGQSLPRPLRRTGAVRHCRHVLLEALHVSQGG